MLPNIFCYEIHSWLRPYLLGCRPFFAVVDCLDLLGQFVNGMASLEALELAQHKAARLANSHAGSKSIDGCGHAAVSATYAVAKAVEGTAIEAASYAAYATVYAQGGYAAVADRGLFEPEFAWQVASLDALAARLASNAQAATRHPSPARCGR